MKNLTVNEAIRSVAAQIGLDPIEDAFSSSSKEYLQLVSMLQDCGDELVVLHDWEVLQMETSFTTDGSDSYDPPDDFDHMIPGTAWNRGEDYPVLGSESPKYWQALKSGSTAGSIYAVFRQKEGKFFIHPDDDILTVYYEYISTNWLTDSTGVTRKHEITDGGDIILYDAPLIRAYLRSRFLESKGLDTLSAEDVASQFFNNRRSKEVAPEILRVGGTQGGVQFISVRNIPDNGYGS